MMQVKFNPENFGGYTLCLWVSGVFIGLLNKSLFFMIVAVVFFFAAMYFYNKDNK